MLGWGDALLERCASDTVVFDVFVFILTSVAEDGVSIPSSYCAFLAPISTSKLFNEAGGSKDEKDASRGRSLETPYVVLPQSFNFLSGDGGAPGGKCGPKVQQCWEFEHPRKEAFLDPRGLPLTNTHNARSANMSFYIPHAGILHGFAGYFEAVLYGNIGLSIHPERKDAISKDMLSWFPLFFPIKVRFRLVFGRRFPCLCVSL